MALYIFDFQEQFVTDTFLIKKLTHFAKTGSIDHFRNEKSITFFVTFNFGYSILEFAVLEQRQ